jgi:hypothetical protein
MQLAELASGMADDDPTLTGDQLEIFFNSNRTGNEDIWRATRSSITAPWAIPELVVELSSSSKENTPEVTLDGLRIYLASNRDGNDNIYVASRESRTAPWSVPVMVAELNTTFSDVAAVPTADDLELFMSRGIGGDNEIMRATRPDAGVPWATPVVVPELSSPAFDGDAFTNNDALTIYWCSRRGANADIWSATRPSRDQPFVELAPVDDLDTALEEDDPWISPDGHTMYFSRGTEFGVEMSIWVSTR